MRSRDLNRTRPAIGMLGVCVIQVLAIRDVEYSAAVPELSPAKRNLLTMPSSGAFFETPFIPFFHPWSVHSPGQYFEAMQHVTKRLVRNL